MAGIRIGISGWSYPRWRGTFYPAGLPARRELEYAAGRFGAIEINASFYRMQSPDSYRRWRETAPAGFRFAVKGSRFLTHNKKLRNVEAPLGNFFGSGLLLLREKLGPILWQLSGSLRFDAGRIADFLDLLPRDTAAAARVAAGHDRLLRHPPALPGGPVRRLRHVLEVRHPSYATPAFVRILRDRNVGLVVSDSPDWPLWEEITSGLVYVRLHGSRERYASRYTDGEIEHWAARIRAWSQGSEPPDAVRITGRRPPPRKGYEVYAFFDNDAKVHAPADALRLMERLGLNGAEPRMQDR